MAQIEVWFRDIYDCGLSIGSACAYIGNAFKELYGIAVVDWSAVQDNKTYRCQTALGDFTVSKFSSGFHVTVFGTFTNSGVISISAVLEDVFETVAYPFHINYDCGTIGYDLSSQTWCKGLGISEDRYMEIWEQEVEPLLEGF